MPPMSFFGVVTKAGFMNKTVTVTVTRQIQHQLTSKRIARSKKYLVHDENNILKKDDEVYIINCAPISASKRFKLHQLVKSPETEREEARAKRLRKEMKQNPTQQSEPSTSSPILEALSESQAKPLSF
ncbi:nucleic acid-binding protein [Coprinopsis marcescibilis]|uniref:Nucleic acid-binding protein n=1 Tax=Coprinopsis marcescibilis TaxID=230819 RepID=A0A5C3LDC4_COPMA|nr:nucleic acid-binding protein [Coprinopsis marcescibilis]